MKRSHKIIAGLAASVALAAAAIVYADPAGSGPCMGAGMGPHGMTGKMGAGNPAAMVDSHLTSLKSALNLTPGRRAPGRPSPPRPSSKRKACKQCEAQCSRPQVRRRSA